MSCAIVGGSFSPMLPQLNPNEEDRMVTIAGGIIVVIFVLWGLFMFFAVGVHAFNTVVDWFMR